VPSDCKGAKKGCPRVEDDHHGKEPQNTPSLVFFERELFLVKILKGLVNQLLVIYNYMYNI